MIFKKTKYTYENGSDVLSELSAKHVRLNHAVTKDCYLKVTCIAITS